MATYDLADMVARMRQRLGDTTLPVLWTDDDLALYVDQAWALHSNLLPSLVRIRWDVADGAQDLPLYPALAVPTTSTVSAGYLVPPTIPHQREVLYVVGVEFPIGMPIPESRLNTTLPQTSHASRVGQSYTWWPYALHLRVPASGGTGGPPPTTPLLAYVAQSWLRPGFVDCWDGPEVDLPLFLLLAVRSAYEVLQQWQVRTQGLTTPAIAGSSTNVHLDVASILASTEIEIARELEARRPRMVIVPPPPAGS